MVFTDSAQWSGNTSRAAANWNKWLVNYETHTIAIPTSAIAKFGYEPGNLDTQHSERFGIAMFHQLHCLVRHYTPCYQPLFPLGESADRGAKQATIREFAYLSDADRMPHGVPLDHDGVSFSPFHMDHCFNYLRQSIECAGDLTVEWAKINADGVRKGIQGWGIAHEGCRDRDALEDFALKHHNIAD